MRAQQRMPLPEQRLLHREGELLSNFARELRETETLPRRMRRSLERQWKRTIAGVTVRSIIVQALALATTNYI
jgi:hypothetical protein